MSTLVSCLQIIQPIMSTVVEGKQYHWKDTECVNQALKCSMKLNLLKKLDYEFHRHPALLFLVFFLTQLQCQKYITSFVCVCVYMYELKSHIYLCVHACIYMIKIQTRLVSTITVFILFKNFTYQAQFPLPFLLVAPISLFFIHHLLLRGGKTSPRESTKSVAPS